MGWCTDDGEHEGYVENLLPDGQATTTSTARRDADGRLVHYAVVWDGTPRRQRLIPNSQICGWRLACSCGWTGTHYTRVTDPTQASEIDGRIYLATDDGGDIPQEFEDALHREWQRVHLAPTEALDDISAAAAAVARQQRELAQAVQAARERGLSWEKIGSAAGVTRQTAHERWGNRLYQA